MTNRRPWRRFPAWVGSAAVAGPASIFLHEAGHFLAAHVLGFRDPVLSYGSVGVDKSGQPAWALVLQAGMGPAVTLAIMLGCCLWVRHRGARPWAVALGFVAPLRFLVGAVYLLSRLQALARGGAIGQPNFDEYNVAAALGIMVEPLIVLELAVSAWAWTFLYLRISRGGRLPAMAGLIVGAALGAVLWLGVLGPRLLP